MLLKDTLETIGADDWLGQGEALDTLVEALGLIQPPACVALYGAWGSGKSTMLHNAQQRWRGPSVWFDPWHYERGEDVVTPLLGAFARQVHGKTGASLRARELVIGLVKSLTSFAFRAGAAWAFGPSAMAVRPLEGTKAEDFLRYFEGKAFDDQVEAIKKQFKALVDLAVEESGADRVVFFLDDLDRCLPDTVVGLIEAVKLLLCGATDCRAVFVFALDRRIVGEAIRHRFPGSMRYTGENYLEKVFDLSLEAPPVDGSKLKRFIGQQIGGKLEDLTKPFDGRRHGHELLLEVLCEAPFANPRVIKRSLNRLRLLLEDGTRRERLTAVKDEGRYRQFLAWLVGAERYRDYRTFFTTASEAEVMELHSRMRRAIVNDISYTGRVESDLIQSFVETPGFIRYYDLLFATKGGWDTRARDRTDSLSTLADFDDLLRRAGL